MVPAYRRTILPNRVVWVSPARWGLRFLPEVVYLPPHGEHCSRTIRLLFAHGL